MISENEEKERKSEENYGYINRKFYGEKSIKEGREKWKSSRKSAAEELAMKVISEKNRISFLPQKEEKEEEESYEEGYGGASESYIYQKSIRKSENRRRASEEKIGCQPKSKKPAITKKKKKKKKIRKLHEAENHRSAAPTLKERLTENRKSKWRNQYGPTTYDNRNDTRRKKAKMLKMKR